MAALSIRNLDDDIRERLRVRAARNGRSMEAEVRAILVESVSPEHEEPNWAMVLHERFAALGGVELDIPPRSTSIRQVDLPE